MRKLSCKLFLLTAVMFGVCNVQAQTQTQSAAMAAPGSDQAASADSANSDSFGDIAALGQQISVAQRKIQAMQLKNNLASLEEQQNKGYFPYKVLRVEGFGESLYAILSDDAGVIYQVGPGDLVANQYRVTLLRASSVGVIDINSRRSYAVPFALGDAGTNTDSVVESIGDAQSVTQAGTPVTPTTSMPPSSTATKSL